MTSTLESVAPQHDTSASSPHADIVSTSDDVAISVRGVGKMYRIYDQPQDRLKQMLWRGRRQYGREFWALRDVSLEVHKGETVGIVGKNGSGKSTLLQIIAGTSTPTMGNVQVQGRVAALLELGSGFNPEFTGRENVFLNGTILGIDQAEMLARFDQIAAFADIGGFIDQPVKTYSSGMMMRLAFAVASSVEPDILIVDEALSVGDVYFQHKCMRRIKQLVDNGTALLFVSHGTDVVKRFCARGLWLDSGKMRYYGPAGVAVEKYLASMRMAELDDLSNTTTPYDQTRQYGDLNVNDTMLDEDIDVELPSALSTVTHEVDVNDSRLFLRGDWQEISFPGVPLPVRSTGDSTALAAFRCTGSQITLTFVGGPDAGTTQVNIDGRSRLLDLFRPNGQRLEPCVFNVLPGNHIVTIRPFKQANGRVKSTHWVGGRVQMSAPLTFIRDPHLGERDSEVERYGTEKARITAVRLLDYTTRTPVKEVVLGQRVRLQIHAERVRPAGPRLEFSYIVRDRNRVDLFGTTTIDEGIWLDPFATQFVIEFAFDIRLGPGSYSILASFVECSEDLHQRVPMDQIDIAYTFSVGFNSARPVWYVFHEPTSVSANVDGEHL